MHAHQSISKRIVPICECGIYNFLTQLPTALARCYLHCTTPKRVVTYTPLSFCKWPFLDTIGLRLLTHNPSDISYRFSRKIILDHFISLCRMVLPGHDQLVQWKEKYFNILRIKIEQLFSLLSDC